MRKGFSKIIVHLVLWSISFLLLYKLFTSEYDSGIADIIYTALFHVPLLFAVYINLPLMRSLFVMRKYITYLLALILLTAFCVAVYFLLFQYLVPLLLKNYYFIAYYTPGQIAQFITAYSLLTILFYLSTGWFTLREKEYQLQKENHLVQLKNLKAQINPHFLFNSLNNIYALAGPDDGQVRTYLTKLSDALRYMIYDTDVELVPLKNEVEYLENYFDLERLRLGDGAQVSFAKTGKVDQYLIAPLLLLPIVENCFRHCDRRSPLIEILLSVKDDQLSLITKNNRERDPALAKGGVGLDNVSKRLQLIYGADAELKITDDGDFFSVILNINLRQE